MLEKEIILIRHAEVEGNVNETKSFEKITSEGKKQIIHMKKLLKNKKFNSIFTSNLERAHKTAIELKKINPKAKFIVDSNLSEIYRVLIGAKPKKGMYGMIKKDKIRIENFWNKILKRKEKKIAIVTHAHVIQYIIGKILHIPRKHQKRISIDNCSSHQIYFWKKTPFYLPITNSKDSSFKNKKLFIESYID